VYLLMHAALGHTKASLRLLMRPPCPLLPPPPLLPLLLLLPLFLQGFTIFFAFGFLDPELSHVAATPLRLALCLLLLVPFPCINFAALRGMLPGSNSSSSSGEPAAASSSRSSSGTTSRHAEHEDACDCCSTSSKASGRSSTSRLSRSSSLVLPYDPQLYWQRPLLRQAVVVVQRLLPTYVAVVQLGGFGPRQQALQSMYFSKLWAYLYVGWAGWMLVAVSDAFLCYFVT
jgi:hypothetical protein